MAAAVGISALIALDGESNWLEGALLTIVYVILAVSFFELPCPSSDDTGRLSPPCDKVAPPRVQRRRCMPRSSPRRPPGGTIPSARPPPRHPRTGRRGRRDPGRDRPARRGGEAFRPDLEGLRGVAILMVLLFHAGVPASSAGSSASTSSSSCRASSSPGC